MGKSSRRYPGNSLWRGSCRIRGSSFRRNPAGTPKAVLEAIPEVIPERILEAVPRGILKNFWRNLGRSSWKISRRIFYELPTDHCLQQSRKELPKDFRKKSLAKFLKVTQKELLEFLRISRKKNYGMIP